MDCDVVIVGSIVGGTTQDFPCILKKGHESHHTSQIIFISTGKFTGEQDEWMKFNWQDDFKK